MNPQCMLEVRDRDRYSNDFAGRWTGWKQCTNDGIIILQMKGGKNVRVCWRCLRTITAGQRQERTGNYAVFRSVTK